MNHICAVLDSAVYLEISKSSEQVKVVSDARDKTPIVLVRRTEAQNRLTDIHVYLSCRFLQLRHHLGGLCRPASGQEMPDGLGLRIHVSQNLREAIVHLSSNTVAFFQDRHVLDLLVQLGVLDGYRYLRRDGFQEFLRALKEQVTGIKREANNAQGLSR